MLLCEYRLLCCVSILDVLRSCQRDDVMEKQIVLFYNGCCLLAMIEVVTLTDALVTNRKYSSCVMSHFVFIGFLFKLLTDCIVRTYCAMQMMINRRHMMTWTTNEDFITNTLYFQQGWFVVVARIRVRTGKDDEPNHITLTGTLSYQEI